MRIPTLLCIDFDGTVCEHVFPEVGNLLPGAKEYINKLYDEGFYIIIWTCRYGEPLLKAEAFLRKSGINFHQINKHHPDVITQYGNDCRKVLGDIYIDDKQLGGLPSWEEIYNIVHKQSKFIEPLTFEK